VIGRNEPELYMRSLWADAGRTSWNAPHRRTSSAIPAVGDVFLDNSACIGPAVKEDRLDFYENPRVNSAQFVYGTPNLVLRGVFLSFTCVLSARFLLARSREWGSRARKKIGGGREGWRLRRSARAS
jgi:hypothetical protein